MFCTLDPPEGLFHCTGVMTREGCDSIFEEKMNGAVKNISYDPFGLNVSCFYLAKLVVYCDGFFQSKY